MTNYKDIFLYAILIIVLFTASQHLNVVVSGSMEPVFYRGDIVIVEKTNFFGFHEFDPHDVKVGDIVVYNAVWHNSPVVHRIVNITEINGTTYYEIKGDNNQRSDPYYVSPEQIQERVLTFNDQPLIIPKLGYITIILRGY